MKALRNSAPGTAIAAAALAAVSLAPRPALAAITFSITDVTAWDSAARRDAAISALTTVCNLYNTYGDFGNHNINVQYNSGVETADCSFYGTMRFGGTYPNQRVTQHESNHFLGSGTTSNWTNKFSGGLWTGAKMNALVAQFDGDGTVIHQSGVHFYGYGLNYDSEVVNGSILTRNIALMYAQRQDDGLGAAADPWSARAVVMKQSDAFGTSSFNWTGNWNDSYFAHANADYFTGNYLVRTPLDTYAPGAATPNFTFVGDSLTLNNRGDAGGGLLFKGVGTTGVVTIKNLILDGGAIHHGSGAGDVFNLAGKLKVVSASTITPENGSINVQSDISGVGPLTIGDGNGTVTFNSGNNTFRGNLDVKGKFVLADDADFRFVIGPSGVNSAITGTTADSVLFNGDFLFELTDATSIHGDTWQLVTAVNVTYGSTFSVIGFTETSAGTWTTLGGYVFTESTGRLTHLPEPASLTGVALAALFLRRRRPLVPPPGMAGRGLG